MKKVIVSLGLLIIGSCASAKVETLTLEEPVISQHLVDENITHILDGYSAKLGKLLDSIDETRRKKGGRLEI